MFIATLVLVRALIAAAGRDGQHEFMSIGEVAELTRKSLNALYSMRYTGTGPPSFRLGRRLVYRRTDVLAWIERHAAADKHSGVAR
ncbi:MAG TPA: helix-turn-helix domain-containing protein [Actinomycetota bacterium]|nr:helix-turn-helix domain-containing protein [Actinomycetota bacterium]